MENIFGILVLIASFLYGLICINNPLVVMRAIAAWFKFASGSSFEEYKVGNAKLNEIYTLIEKPAEFMQRFPEIINRIRMTGYVAIFVALGGACIIMLGGYN